MAENKSNPDQVSSWKKAPKNCENVENFDDCILNATYSFDDIGRTQKLIKTK